MRSVVSLLILCRPLWTWHRVFHSRSEDKSVYSRRKLCLIPEALIYASAQLEKDICKLLRRKRWGSACLDYQRDVHALMNELNWRTWQRGTQHFIQIAPSTQDRRRQCWASTTLKMAAIQRASWRSILSVCVAGKRKDSNWDFMVEQLGLACKSVCSTVNYSAIQGHNQATLQTHKRSATQGHHYPYNGHM